MLSPADDLDSEVVVLVDSFLARRFFPGQDPVGQTLTIPHWGAAHAVASRIVGVVGHVEHYGLDGSAGEKPQLAIPPVIPIIRPPDDPGVDEGTEPDEFAELPAPGQTGGWRGFLSRIRG